MELITSGSRGLLALWLVLLGIVSLANASEPMSKSLMDLTGPSASSQWISVNDGVMGGVSEGAFRIAEKETLVFYGNLSLENRGGFASIRTRPSELNLEGYDTIKLKIRGDGRTYYFDLRTPSLGGAESYRVPVETRKGVWQEVSLPLKDFEYTSYGRRVSGASPLRASMIRSFGFMLADKQPGPFRLEVQSITAEKSGDDPQPAGTKDGHGSSEPMDILETAVAAGQFKTLVAAVKAADLVEVLKGKGPFTVFAPTDDAFGKLPEGTVEELLQPDNREKLRAVLTYHVVPERVFLGGHEPNTLQGQALEISAWGPFEVNGATVTAADISASNGIIHVIDAVLIPPANKLTPRQAARSVIERAIERGVPLFNAGQHSSCAAVYDVAIESLLKSHANALSESERKMLEEAVRKTQDDKTPGEQAWTLRRTLDAVYRSLATD